VVAGAIDSSVSRWMAKAIVREMRFPHNAGVDLSVGDLVAWPKQVEWLRRDGSVRMIAPARRESCGFVRDLRDPRGS
jgi:hypothetical protein